ncbi:MAG: hypothetical protein AB7V77_04810 [Candidatus Woesearchaeota archaeon]
MSELIIGIIIGTITTMIGFFMSLLWEDFKLKKELEDKKNQFLQLVTEEIKENADILTHNLSILNEEKEAMNTKGVVVMALSPLKYSFWDLLKSHFDVKFLSEKELKKIRDISLDVLSLNATMQSREMFRINNKALTNYLNSLKTYDEFIYALSKTLLNKLNNLKINTK